MDEPVRIVRGPLAPLTNLGASADDRGMIQPTRLAYSIVLADGMLVTGPDMFPDARGPHSAETPSASRPAAEQPTHQRDGEDSRPSIP